MPVMNRVRIIGICLLALSILVLFIVVPGFEQLSKSSKALTLTFIPVFIPFGLSMLFISEEYPVRKKAANIFLATSILFTLTGIILQLFHFDGGSSGLIIGILIYCFSFAPIELKNKYQKWRPYSTNLYEIILLSSMNFVGLNMVLIGLMFKSQSWPFANSLLLSGTIVSVGGMLLWNQKFKTEIVKRKRAEEKITEQFQLIHDSINYSKRIQDAKLPSKIEICEMLPDSFVLFKPKDVVSGDFYFFKSFESSIVFGAADCTGHGVPGALLTMIGAEILENQVTSNTNVSQVLTGLNNRLRFSLKQSEDIDSTRDGMDIALCRVHLGSLLLEYAGANRPLWIIRKGLNSIEEIKATKKAIGGFTPDDQSFELHQVQLVKGDMIYLFSDGYADTFGGDSGKKLTTKRFREILLSVADQSMKKQGDHLENFINSWKSKTEQVDDILVIGIRI